jgi:hypothetical protein
MRLAAKTSMRREDDVAKSLPMPHNLQEALQFLNSAVAVADISRKSQRTRTKRLNYPLLEVFEVAVSLHNIPVEFLLFCCCSIYYCHFLCGDEAWSAALNAVAQTLPLLVDTALGTGSFSSPV